VGAASRKSQEEEESALRNIGQRQQWIQSISDIFHRFDSDSDGCLTWEDFSTMWSDWQTRMTLEEMGIEISFQHATLLFKLFDWDGDGSIDIDDFTQGVYHLRGTARSLDMYRQFIELSRQVNRLIHMVHRDRHPVMPVSHDRQSCDGNVSRQVSAGSLFPDTPL
jgi:hypothetical protein